MVTEIDGEDVERAAIERCLTAIERVTGARPAGWFSTGYGESTRTLDLLADAGLRYVCDWPNDEQPYRIGRLVAVPAAFDLDDEATMRLRSVPVADWADMVVRAAGRLASDGVGSGRLLVLPLHPYIVGQPFRVRHLERALAAVAARDDVWLATADDVVDHVAPRFGSLTRGGRTS
jgi:peptidoglycan/xylan/chitin deacetylase (PgdA/CDA1 family)